jgi:hypothetical protein
MLHGFARKYETMLEDMTETIWTSVTRYRSADMLIISKLIDD